MRTPFVKLEATGNDFVVVDVGAAVADRAAVDAALLPLATRMALCARHTGVGADGVLSVLQAPKVGAMAGRYRMHITNPDGSVPEMCGNGLRCVARHLSESGRIDVDVEVVVDTDAGPRTVRVQRDHSAVTIDMGSAAFVSPRQFPTPLSRSPLSARGAVFARATTVSMGNPHVVLEVDALPTRAEAAEIGAAIEHDRALFPERTNVEWVVVRDAHNVDVLVWERGAGLTQACGTGACGVVAVLVRHGVVAPGTTTVHLPGGPLAITVSSLQAPILMQGPVRRVFAGVADA